MDSNDFNLGYEEVYNDRLGETKSMITLATLLDSLDQGAEGVRYNAVMRGAYEIAEKANPSGLPSSTPDVTLVSSVIRSNVKLMIYNIIEYSVTNLMQAIYDRVKDEGCGYAEVSEKLQSIWHHTQMYNGLSDPKASNSTAESISKRLLDHVVKNNVLQFSVRNTIAGGNLDADKILKLFDDHGISIHDDIANCKRDEIKSELKDIKNRRNDLAHGSISFAEASNQVTTSELAELVNHVDSFLMQLRKDVSTYLNAGEYRRGMTESEEG